MNTEQTYKDLSEQENFSELLKKAIKDDKCLFCGASSVMSVGLCSDCRRQTSHEDKRVMHNLENGEHVQFFGLGTKFLMEQRS